MDVQSQPQSLAVVGGGITGIAAALTLARSGKFRVTVLEKQKELGGLDLAYKWQDLVCDRFYHVVLPTDACTLEFIADLGLSENVYWRKVKSGFFGQGQLVSLSSLADFVRFPFLSFGQKIRLGLGIFYAARLKKLSHLDDVSSPQWLSRIFGREVYQRIWEPLLRSKLGEAAERTSAAFMWATIRRLYGARGSKSKQEIIGYWRGGYDSLLKAAEKKLIESGVSLVTGEPVEKIGVEEKHKYSGGYRDSALNVDTPSGSRRFDRILLTVPCPEVLKLIKNNSHSYWERLQAVEYLGVAGVLLVLKRSLSPYYVINLLDKDFPFTGIVETTNIIPPSDLGDRHLVYLAKYVTSKDPLTGLSDTQMIAQCVGRLKAVFFDLRDDDILHLRVFREPHVQPIPALNFLSRPIAPLTPLKNVYLANTAMIPDSLHNNNANIKLARDVAALIASQP
jgi:protoporphyrinogen oxidase